MGRLNRPAIGDLPYRSPGQTNANDVLPNLGEDVVRSQGADAERIRRGMNTADVANSANRARSQTAAARAITRTLGRANAVGAAGLTGWELGRALDEQTGVGRKMVDAGIGKAVDQVAAPDKDRVTLTPAARARLAAGELDNEAPRNPMPAAPPARKRAASAPSPSGSVREGRNENIDDDVRARAMRSVSSQPDDTVSDSGRLGGDDGMKRGGKVSKFAKGGAVRGWGLARGSRAAKMK